ncbi:hypothetical protein BKA82DRAFT_1000279 [Pisolithus tinctorius]|nr:hypothetical protein BKA82DRAFT_1000279 [Pisolithus tinctorius]
MMTSANLSADTYTRLLAHAEPERGYHLWLPEPRVESASKYPHESVRIGDVGVISPEGNFDVFFNICLPQNHPRQHPHGVPEGFKQIKLSSKDVKITEDPDYRGCIATTENCKTRVNVTGANPNLVTVKGTESELTPVAALLIVPSGADKYDVRDPSVFQMEAIRMGKTWYEFALNKLARTTISHDSLYLITGHDKVSRWRISAINVPNDIGVQYTKNRCTIRYKEGQEPNKTICRSISGTGKIYAVSTRGFKIAINEKMFCSLLQSSNGEGLPTDFNHKIYHPLDGINSILLDEAHHCDMAVTHDNMWKDIVDELPSIRSGSEEVAAAITRKGYVLLSHAGCAYFTKCGDDLMYSSRQGFMGRAMTKLASLVKNKQPKYIDNEEKREKASHKYVDSGFLSSVCRISRRIWSVAGDQFRVVE